MAVTTDRTKIVIVEDNEMDSALLESKLKEHLDYETVVYTSSDPLFTYLDTKTDIDVVILDDELPGTRAVDTIEKIRKKSPYTEVIVLCKNGDDKYHDRLKTAGAYNFVKKDRSGIDKIVAYIEALRHTMKVRRENVHLKSKARKNSGTTVFLVILLIAIVAGVIYYLTK